MATININRPVYDHTTFKNKYYEDIVPEVSLLQRIGKCCKNKLVCSGPCVRDKILSFLPFIFIMKSYNWRSWILKDLVAGICVGVIHIPQSMGFSLLTSLPPVYGLYSTFFPAVIYFFFGTSRHISMGTMAVISIMIGTIVDREADLYKDSFKNNVHTTNFTEISTASTENTSSSGVSEHELERFKVDIAVSVSLLMGIFLLGMRLLNLGLLATFMSSSFVGGFMTGAACHIITSQAPFGLGFTIPRQAGMFRVPKSWYLIFDSITETNPADIITFLLSSIFLLACKIVNDKYKDKMKIPIPSELLVIVATTLVSYLVNMHKKFDVRILEYIPTGIPVPQPPSFHNVSSYALDSFIISIVSFAICISMAKNYSQKYRYTLNQNQELFALGLMHSVSSFFHCFAGAQAPPRTLVHEGTGGKTQVASLFSAFLVLLVCLVLAPLFEPLPNSALSSIIIVALLPLFLQFGTMPHFWKVNRFDCIIWLATFFSCVILNMDIGLGIGIFISLLSLIVETYLATGTTLAVAKNTELFYVKKSAGRIDTNTQQNIFVFKFDSPLYFANVERFKNQLFNSTINPLMLVEQLAKSHKKVINGRNSEQKNPDIKINGKNVNDGFILESEDISTDHLHEANTTYGSDTAASTHNVVLYPEDENTDVVILDCSAISYIDLMALDTLKVLRSLYEETNVSLLMANCPQSLLSKMSLHGMDTTNGIYPSIQDATAGFDCNFQVTRF